MGKVVLLLKDDLFLNLFGNVILVLIVILISGCLYVQRINLMEFANGVEGNAFVLNKYVERKWTVVLPGVDTRLYLLQAAWDKGLTQAVLYVVAIFGSSCCLSGLLCKFYEINWPILLIVGGSINEVINNVNDFYGVRI